MPRPLRRTHTSRLRCRVVTRRRFRARVHTRCAETAELPCELWGGWRGVDNLVTHATQSAAARWLGLAICAGLLGCSAYDDRLLIRIGLRTTTPDSDSGMVAVVDGGTTIVLSDCRDGSAI